MIAEEEKSKILKEAQHKAELIQGDAKRDTEKLEKELKEQWVASVKETSKKVVKRLLKHDKVLEDEYFGVLVEDLKN